MSVHAQDAAMAAPPVGVGALTLWGVSLNEWVLLATLVYTTFLIIDKLPAVLARVRAGWRWVKERYGQGK